MIHYTHKKLKQESNNKDGRCEIIMTNDIDVEKLLQDISGEQMHHDRDGYRVNCFFHADTSYDLKINTDGRYYCFSCGEKGKDFLSLLSKLYNIPEISFDEETESAFDLLYSYGGSSDGEAFPSRRPPLHISNKYNIDYIDALAKKNLQAAHDYYTGDFHGDQTVNLNYGKITAGYLYLYGRGFLSETLKHFHIVDWQRFSQHPIFIPYVFNDVPFGYEQRRITSETWPKVISMPGTQKTEHVDGYTPTGARFGLVTEGKLDQILSWQYGFREQAQFSILGSHVSATQAKIMAEAQCELYISAFDNDEAGEKAHESFMKEMRPYETDIVRMYTGANGLSFIPRQQFQDALSKCIGMSLHEYNHSNRKLV